MDESEPLLDDVTIALLSELMNELLVLWQMGWGNYFSGCR